MLNWLHQSPEVEFLTFKYLYFAFYFDSEALKGKESRKKIFKWNFSWTFWRLGSGSCLLSRWGPLLSILCKTTKHRLLQTHSQPAMSYYLTVMYWYQQRPVFTTKKCFYCASFSVINFSLTSGLREQGLVPTETVQEACLPLPFTSQTTLISHLS